MNKRIKELADQAEREVNEVFVWWPEGPDREDVIREKFAELIIKECIAKCEVVANMATITNTGEIARKTKATADSCATMIKEHFGVK